MPVIEIIDPEGDRQKRNRNRLIVICSTISFFLFSFPLVKEFRPRWQALRAARILAEKLIQLRSQSIQSRTAVDVRIKLPDLIEVYNVEHCGLTEKRQKAYDFTLATLTGLDIVFVPEKWVRENGESNEPYITRYCYDPSHGSSLIYDGVQSGAVFLSHRDMLSQNDSYFLSKIIVSGQVGQVTVE